MDHHHSFDYVEGTIPVPIAPGSYFTPSFLFRSWGVRSLRLSLSQTQTSYLWLKLALPCQAHGGVIFTDSKCQAEIQAYYPDSDSYFNYFDFWSPASIRVALAQLATFIALEGPYDGVVGYSHGAALAATFLIQHSRLHPGSPLPFKCGVFLSGGIPMDLAALEEDELKPLNAERDGVLLGLPTAHIWGRNDKLWPGSSELLSGLCEERVRSVFVHDEGHDIPSARSKEAVLGAVRAIRRTLDRALSAQ